MTKVPQTKCYKCDSTMDKAVAVFDGKGYCRKCYGEFDVVPCPGDDCKRNVHIPKGAEPQLCQVCRLKGRACARCEKPLKRASRIVGDKAYCFPCSRHLDPPKPCALCGEPTIFLARDLKHGIDVLACAKCRRKHSSNITCYRCRRHRPYGGVNDEGKKLCVKCHADYLEGEQPFVCPKCHKPARMNGEGLCETCYRQGLVRRKILAASEGFNHEWVKELVAGYAETASLVTPRHIMRQLKAHMEFFRTIDSSYNSPDDVSLYSLTMQFGSNWERRYGPICSHLIKIGLIPPHDDPEHREMAEFAKQMKRLGTLRGRWYQRILIEFQEYLQKRLDRYRCRGWSGKHIRYRQRAITISLGTAARFLESIGDEITFHYNITQMHVDRFQFQLPGHYASLPSFLKFLNRSHGKKQTFERLATMRRPRFSQVTELSEDEFQEMLISWLDPAPGKTKGALMGLFALLYAQQPRRIARMLLHQVKKDDDGIYNVTFGKVPLRMSEEVGRVLGLYLAERRVFCKIPGIDNPYLFPGVIATSHISEQSIGKIFATYGMAGRRLFATSMMRTFRPGIQSPRVAQDAYDICGFTAGKYFGVVDVRLRNEIRGKDA